VLPLLTTTQQAQRAEDQFRDGLSDTLIAEYIAQAQSQVPVTVNQQALQSALGAGG
jgi:peptidyl-prolyl cis-trans isomerase D